MSESSRRTFLATLAASAFVGVGVARSLVGASPVSAPRALASSGGDRGVLPPHRVPTVLGPPPLSALRPLPASGTLTLPPPHDNTVALTLDDGVNTEVVRLYTQFALDTGVRLTFFVNGVNRSWADRTALLHPLVDSGQIQLANHTWSHPDLTRVSKDRIAAEITRNEAFLKKTYGVDPAPYLRPPYGFPQRRCRCRRSRLGPHGNHHVVGFVGRFHGDQGGLHRGDGR